MSVDLSGAIRSVSMTTGIIRTVAGTGSKATNANTGNGGPATAARFNAPTSVTSDTAGGFYMVRLSQRTRRYIRQFSLLQPQGH